MKIVIPTEDERIDLIAPRRLSLPLDEVLSRISPVCPDELNHRGDSVYEAVWQDEERGAEEIVELSKDWDGVRIISRKAYRPRGELTGVAIEFCLIPTSYQASEMVN